MKAVITSRDNPLVGNLRSLRDDPTARRRERAFIVEGISLVEEAVASGMALRLVVSQSQGERPDIRKLVRQAEARQVDVLPFSDNLVKSVSSLTTSPGVLSVVRMPEWQEDEVLGRARPLLLLCGLQDPGNMGTIIRTAEAAGAGGIFCAPGTVDQYNPKVVRGSMGSILRVPVIAVDDPCALLGRASRAGYAVIATGANSCETCFNSDLTTPFLLLVGQEASGVPADLLADADRTISIPMEGEVESLNAAMAAGIILFEAKRQKITTF